MKSQLKSVLVGLYLSSFQYTVSLIEFVSAYVESLVS